MPPTIILIGVGILVLIVIVVVVVLISGRGASGGASEARKAIKSWNIVGDALHLVFRTPEGNQLEKMELKGTYRKRQIAAAIRTRAILRAMEQELTHQTIVEVQVHNSLRHFIRINKKHGYHKTDRYLGQPHIETGILSLDSRYDFKAIPNPLITRVFETSPGLIDRLSKLRQGQYCEIEVEGNVVHYEAAGVETDPEYMKNILDLMCDLGEAIEKIT